MRLQAQIDQLRMFSVVVVLLRLHAWVGEVVDLHGDAEFFCGGFHQMRQLQDGKLFRELIVAPALASGCRVVTGDLDATYRVPNVEETARLSALPVNGEWLADGRLHAETIKDGAENVVIIEPIDQRLIERSFVRHRPINNALIEVGGANP